MELGDYYLEGIQEGLASGYFSTDDFGWHPGLPAWITLGEVVSRLTAAPVDYGHRRSIPDRLLQLENLARSGELDPAGFEALAEACFRVAVTPGQSPSESVRLLRRAVRFDGTNPKHAYLLSRVYFLHGDFDRASRWLRVAACNCPTSHRIWSHVALLQRELNLRYRGNDAYEPDDLRQRAVEVLHRVRLGLDGFPSDLLEFRPRESGKKQQKREEKRAFRDEEYGGETAEGDESKTSSRPKEPAFPTVTRSFADVGGCRWSGAIDLTLEGIFEGAASELSCIKARPLLRQAARMAAMRRGGTAAFAILAIEWCVAGFPIEMVEHLRRTFPPNLDAHSLRMVDFACQCFRLPDAEVPKFLSDGIAAGEVPAVLAAILHQRCLLWQSLDARAFVKHSAGRRWLERYRGSKADLTASAAEMARVLKQTASSFAPKPRPQLSDAMKVAPNATPDWLGALALIDDASAQIAAIIDAAAPVVTQGEGCSELVRALENAVERAQEQLDDLLVAAFGTTPPDGCRAAAARSRRTLNVLLYAKPIASRFPSTTSDVSSSAAASTEIGQWCNQANAILADGAGGINTAAEQLLGLESSAREFKVHVEKDWKTLALHLERKKNGDLDEPALAECVAIAARVEKLITDCGDKIRKIANVRSTGELRDWTPEEVFAAKHRLLTQQAKVAVQQCTVEQINAVTNPLPPSEVKRLDEAERAWRDLASYQGRFRRVLVQLALPAAAPAKPGEVREIHDTQSEQPAPENEPSLIGVPLVEHTLSQFSAQVAERFATVLDSFKGYTPDQMTEPALAALVWSIRARQAEALYHLGNKIQARRVWAKLLREDRLSVPVLKNIAVALTGGAETGCELEAWRNYVEMLYFQDCTRHSPRPQAAARALFHRNFGSACAPECILTAKREGALTEAEETSLVSFLESPSRVRSYVSHKILEFFNRKLDFASPTLVLGCERNEHETNRTLAAKKMLAFADRCLDLIPPRVGQNFLSHSRRYIELAQRNCKDLHHIVEDVDYTAEHQRQLAWVRELAMLKIRIADCIINSKELPRRVTSLAFLHELGRLDDVPMDLSPNVLLSVDRKAEALVNYMAGVQARFLQNVTEFLNEKGGEDAICHLRERQFERLTGEWLGLPVVKGSKAVFQVLINHLESAEEGGEHERVCQIAILIIRADDRRAAVAQLGLVKFLAAAEAARRCLLHRELADEITAWIGRARRHLESHVPDKADKDALTEEAITKISDTLGQVLTGVFLAPHIDVKMEERVRRLEIPLEELVREHPSTRPCRMMKYWEFASEAFSAKQRADLIYWIRLCKADVEAILNDEETSQPYRARAERIQANIAEAGF